MQRSTNTRNGKLTRLTQTTTELGFEVSLKIIPLNPHPILSSTQLKHQTLPCPFVMISLQLTCSDELPFGYQCGTKAFYNHNADSNFEKIF